MARLPPLSPPPLERLFFEEKFEFFEEKYSGKSSIPDEVAGNVECYSSGRGKIVVGCDDGTVSLLDRGLKFNYGFQAHTSSVLFLQHLKPEGPSTSSLDCIQILRICTNQFPEAKVKSLLVLEEAPPILLIAIGLDNGCIYYSQGDIARERIKRFRWRIIQIKAVVNNRPWIPCRWSNPSTICSFYLEETIGRPPELPGWIISGAVVGMQGGADTVHRVWDELKTYDVPVSASWLQDWVVQRETDRISTLVELGSGYYKV